jgi:peptidoglycan/LPS O-acetylase OafA/YrhL
MLENKAKYFPALDGLRAISVLLVIFIHLKYRSPVLSHIQGWLGVDVFFVISGFLITTLLFREERETGKIDIFAFYTRRFFRIVPIYGLVLIVYIVLCSLHDDKWVLMKHALPYYLTFMNEFVVADHLPFGTTWTLGVEEKFYLVWPVLFFLAMRGKRNRWLMLLVLFASTVFMPFRMARSYFGLLAGCSLAVAFADASIWRCVKTVARMPPVVLMILVGLGFCVVDFSEKFVFFFSGIVTLLLAHVISASTWIERGLSNTTAAWVGRRSYCMYLIHGLVLDAVQHFIDPFGTLRQVAVTLVSFAICALAADVLFRFVEDPARRFGKKILAKRKLALTIPGPATLGQERVSLAASS